MPQEDPHEDSLSADDTNQSIQQANPGEREPSRDEMLIRLFQSSRHNAKP